MHEVPLLIVHSSLYFGLARQRKIETKGSLPASQKAINLMRRKFYMKYCQIRVGNNYYCFNNN